jgi:hypothetical protein
VSARAGGPQGPSSSGTAWRELRKAGPCGCCDNGLSPSQRSQFAEESCFEVVGGDTGKRYRIHAGAATNVCELDERGRPTLGLCFLPMGDLPIGDVMLSQKIALESAESYALRAARRFAPDGTFRRRRLLR